MKYANRWRGVGHMEREDLEQCGFIAVMEAASTYSGKAAFNTWLDVYIKREFNIACGQRTERQRRDPLLNALSLDAPLTDDTEDPFTLADTLEDPAAATALEAAEDRDRADRLHAILSESIATLTPEQQTAVRDRYWRQRRVDAKVLNKALARLRHPSVSRQLLAYR